MRTMRVYDDAGRMMVFVLRDGKILDEDGKVVLTRMNAKKFERFGKAHANRGLRVEITYPVLSKLDVLKKLKEKVAQMEQELGEVATFKAWQNRYAKSLDSRTQRVLAQLDDAGVDAAYEETKGITDRDYLADIHGHVQWEIEALSKMKCKGEAMLSRLDARIELVEKIGVDLDTMDREDSEEGRDEDDYDTLTPEQKKARLDKLAAQIKALEKEMGEDE